MKNRTKALVTYSLGWIVGYGTAMRLHTLVVFFAVMVVVLILLTMDE